MDDGAKKSRLEHLAKKTLSSPELWEEYTYLFANLPLTEQEVIDAFIQWDVDPDAYGNEFYKSVAARFAMYLKCNTPGSWHIQRQEITQQLLADIQPKSIADVGFGAPQRYVKDIVLKQNISCSLLDLYESAATFSRVLLDFWDPGWRDRIMLAVHDMNTDGFVGVFDTYIFHDSIEHVAEPGKYLTDTVQKAPANAHFIFSLPIAVGDHEPSHTIDWATQSDAERWLEQAGLMITSSTAIHPNRAIDIYAQALAKNYHQLLVSSKKAPSQ